MSQIYSGMPQFDWNADPVLINQWNSQPMRENYPVYGDRGPYRITADALKARPGMAVALTEVEFVRGYPVVDDGEEIVTMAGLYIGSTLCRVLYTRCWEHGTTPSYMTIWNSSNWKASVKGRAKHETIEAAMTDFCEELMLVNPYDHIRTIIGERGIKHAEYQSIEEFGSWA